MFSANGGPASGVEDDTIFSFVCARAEKPDDGLKRRNKVDRNAAQDAKIFPREDFLCIVILSIILYE
jgi:hypothetical protein